MTGNPFLDLVALPLGLGLLGFAPSRRLPVWTGVVLVALGAWSIWFGLFVSLDQPA